MSLDEFQLGEIVEWSKQLGRCVPEHPDVNECYYNALKDEYHMEMKAKEAKEAKEMKELKELEKELLDIALVDAKTSMIEPDAINTRGGIAVMTPHELVNYTLETRLKQMLSQRSISHNSSVRDHVNQCRQYLLATANIKAPQLFLLVS